MSAPDLMFLTRRFVTERVDRKEITRQSGATYRARLFRFAREMDGMPVEKITRRQIERFLGTFGEAGTTKRGALTTLRVFFDWCIAEGYLTRNPTIGVKSPKVAPLLPRALDGEQVEKMMAVASRDKRTLVIILLMLQLGLRRNEVRELRMGDIDWRARTASIRGKGGEGVVTSVLPVTDEVWEAIGDYVAAENVTGAGPVVRSRQHTDRGLTNSYIYRLVAQVMVEAGIKTHARDGVSPHALRHTAAHDLLDEGVDVRTVQQVLRHKSVLSTEVYLRGHVGNLREAMEGRSYGPKRWTVETEARAAEVRS